MLTDQEKLELKELLMKLEDHELQHIFDILKKHDVKFTKNNRGIFFKDSSTDDTILEDIHRYALTRYKEQQLYRQINN